MRLNEEIVIVICIFGGFSILLAVAFGSDYLKYQTQKNLFQQTYSKAIECRVAYKDRDVRYIENVCGKIPEIRDYQK